MARRLSTVVAGIGCAAALLTTAGALAAYGSPRLEVTQSGNTVTIDVAQNPADDATASARIISPIGTEIAAAKPAGTAIGSARATFAAAGGGELTAEGRIVVATSAQVSGPRAPACAAGEPVVAYWLAALAGNGVETDLPIYLLTGGDLLVCLAHPVAGNGSKLVGLQLVLDGALRPPAVGTWISIWVPYGGNAAADTSQIVASPAVVGPGSVTFTARANGRGAVLVGLVRQGGSPRAGARVRITGGPRATGGRVLGTATTNGIGRFTFRAKNGTFFRATATVGRSSPPGICFVLEPFLRPIPCVNPTLNGFSVTSRTVRKG